MAIENILAALVEHATAQSKSTVLKPLAWLLSICAVSILGAVRFSAPRWLMIVLAVPFCLTVLLYCGSFIFCLFTDKDALRTERYSIQKLAIERGFVGDSSVGLKTRRPRVQKTTAITVDESSKEESK